VGPLPFKERAEKIYKFFVKKKQRHLKQKYTYKCRQDVAEKRLRIKGRFVTREQAFEILGLTQDELKSNVVIQKLLENVSVQVNTLIENTDGANKCQRIKIRNFQALIDNNYSHKKAVPSLQEYQTFLPPGEQAELEEQLQAFQQNTKREHVKLQLKITKGAVQGSQGAFSNVKVSSLS